MENPANVFNFLLFLFCVAYGQASFSSPSYETSTTKTCSANTIIEADTNIRDGLIDRSEYELLLIELAPMNCPILDSINLDKNSVFLDKVWTILTCDVCKEFEVNEEYSNGEMKERNSLKNERISASTNVSIVNNQSCCDTTSPRLKIPGYYNFSEPAYSNELCQILDSAIEAECKRLNRQKEGSKLNVEDNNIEDSTLIMANVSNAENTTLVIANISNAEDTKPIMGSRSDLIDYFRNNSNLYVTRQWLVKTSGFVSLASSMWILYDIKKTNSDLNMAHHLIILMSISDIIASIVVYILSSSLAPKGYSWAAIGNNITCSLQGFIGIISVFSSILYNIILTIYFLLIVKYQINKRIFQTYWCRFWMLVFPFALFTIFSTIILLDGGFNWGGVSTSQWCGIDPYPTYCTLFSEIVGNCTRGKRYKSFKFILLVFIVICFVSLVISMILLVQFVSNTYKKSDRYAFQGRVDSVARKNSDKTARVGLLFCASFLLTYSFGFIGDLYLVATGNIEWPMWIMILNCIFLPLQGFFNAFAYSYRKSDNHMLHHIKIAFQRCILKSTPSEETSSNVQTGRTK